MASKSRRLNEEDRRIVSQTNTLLEQLNLFTPISCVEDLNVLTYVSLFEGLCGEHLAGIVRNPLTKEDEIQNCQIVIDTLASDVLHTSLTHISGRQVVEHDRESILHFLEIFSGLLEYILNKIESDASTDNDGEEDVDDPDAVERDVIDEILERELKRGVQDPLSPEGRRRTDLSSVYWDDRPVAASRPKDSPQGRNLKQSQGSSPGIQDSTAVSFRLDSTEDLIRRGEALIRRTHPGEESHSVEESYLKTRPTLHALMSNKPDRLQSRETEDKLKSDPTYAARSTDKLLDHYSDLYNTKYNVNRDQLGQRQPAADQLDPYNNLRYMVEETAALARDAVGVSPNRARTILQSMDNSYNKQASPTRHGARSPHRKTKSPVRLTGSDDDLHSDTELTPSRAKRKVSFLTERSTTDSSPSFLKSSPHKSPPRKAWQERDERFDASPTRQMGRGRSVTRPCRVTEDYGSYLANIDDLEEKENTSAYDDYLKKQFHEIIDEVLSDDEVLPQRFKSRSDQRRVRADRVPDKSKGTYSVVDTHKLMAKERQAGKKKVDFLHKIYQEDLDELKYEAKHELKKDRKSAKDTETVYKKKVLTGQKKGVIKPKESVSSKKKPTVSTKAKRRTPSGLIPAGKPKLTIKDDDDILPLLLKEFPHLHLSLHTWHELWRKGINQIEQVTRANQEVRRKKSHAKAELEEAEKRQQIMVNIMKKELEHQQRMKEIKERQTQGVAAKNRIHEKRTQSAKTRQYYDEYQVRMRSKMLKRRTKEEMVFKKLFKDGLDIQKDRVKELRKYAKEQRDSQSKVQRNEVESLENYYRDQFDMLAESVTKERKETQTREKAQQKVLEQMKKELRRKMEQEIRELQDQLCRDDDDAYFRQLDADRVIKDLRIAKYHVGV
ncbi:centrosomal protein of 95 kDa-like [Mizuhopecten yessoensis]|uniref:centrosomal protein of 95 kDa-like n=1 Tax=Mizuhopecten yessoensis TaxID=6573 RepID=UPI000B45D572|nr:centrosomal protein of 95 kDa-like [Mizuhopecten yessoensis]XP_021350942.1 centrosomal protein of 95 kDa-like [Mizuhopecten yessoensis]XP_021350943.1 centrosomal protein of 95 kDa-like [Mizuhopecten yessoensis]